MVVIIQTMKRSFVKQKRMRSLRSSDLLLAPVHGGASLMVLLIL
jgi:hypothetical protein